MGIVKTKTVIDTPLGRRVKAKLPAMPESNHKKLRKGSQSRAFRALKGKRNVILNAPTGWGKTLVISILVLYKLLRYPKLRCVIAVPQTVIANNFVKDLILTVPGFKKAVDWIVQHNLCHSQSKQTVNSVCRFLAGRHSLLGDRILVCTHATLAAAYKKLQRTKRLRYFNNTILWIDEAHHVMNAQVVDRKDLTISNAIGALVMYCVKAKCHVGLATATFMRGDMRHILPDSVADAFTRFDVPYDEYFEAEAPVESFKFHILCGDWLDGLRQVFRTVRPTIIYLAKRNSQYGTGCKYGEVKDILRLLAKRVKGKITREGELIRIGELRVLDLVNESGRKKRQAYLEAGGPLDIIIALDTCKEGFDWPKAERSVIIGERHSVTEMIQMIGRLFRRSPGKTHADVYQIMPAAVPNAKNFKDQRNAIYTVIFASMLLEDVFVPIKVSGGSQQRGGRSIAGKVPNTDAWQNLNRDFIVAVNACGGDFEKSKRMAPSILKKYGIAKKDWRHVWESLFARLAARTRKIKGRRVDVPFDILKKTDIVAGMLEFTSDLCGKHTFQEMRTFIGREQKTLEEWVVLAEELAIKNYNGELAVSA